MPTERATISQIVQIGVETTPGTPVAATKRLQALGIEPSPNVDIQTFRPMGSKFQTIAQAGRDFVTAGLSGRATYNEIIYALSSVLKSTTPTTPADAGAREWLFEPASYGVDVPKTFTVEHGDGRGDRFAHGIVTDFEIGFSRDEITLGGTMLGKALEDPFTLTTAGITALAAVPIHPDDVSVYMDATSAGLGTTKLLRVLEASFSITNRFGALWVLDRAQSSFVATVELEPTLQLGLTLEADAQGMGLLANARAGDTRFLRIECVGPLITSLNHELRIDMAGKIAEVGDFSDQDGVYAVGFTFNGVHHDAWGTGKALSVLARNTVTTL